MREDVSSQADTLVKASDVQRFCPSFLVLSKDRQIDVLAEMFIAIAYYESSDVSAWNPKQYSVDVGSKNNRDTWSVGLLQLSVVDQESYHLPMGFTFEDLQTAEKNLKLGVAIMAQQVQKRGKILITAGEPGLYWATIHPGGKYDETQNVISRVKNSTACKGAA